MNKVELMLGNCVEQMKFIATDSIDSIVTDPPYGIKFMSKKWDCDVPSVAVWQECLRVLKPGGHLLAFAGTRTQHRMAVNIEDAGFKIRDMMAWIYGSGFPKSHNISKALDKAAGAEREVTGSRTADDIRGGNMHAANRGVSHTIELRDKPATPEAQQWEGWGTALKPALEPITVARKPLSENTVAANVLKHGTGGINIDESRIGGEGRFPANLIHDGGDEVVDVLKDAARFFYCPKASKKDRDEGLDKMEEQQFVQWQTGNGASGKPSSLSEGRDTKRRNTHPTVKPTDLMRYLVRLVTPKGGTVLDPFMGSGSTGKAAVSDGFDFIGIEIDPDYLAIAKERIDVSR